MPDCDVEGRIFLSTPHTNVSEYRFFNNVVTSIFDVHHFVTTTVAFNDVITSSNVNLNDGPLQPVHIKHIKILNFYLTLGRIT